MFPVYLENLWDKFMGLPLAGRSFGKDIQNLEKNLPSGNTFPCSDQNES